MTYPQIQDRLADEIGAMYEKKYGQKFIDGFVAACTMIEGFSKEDAPNTLPDGAIFYKQQEFEGLKFRFFISGYNDVNPILSILLVDTCVQINLKAVDAYCFGKSITDMAGNAILTRLESLQNDTQNNTPTPTF